MELCTVTLGGSYCTLPAGHGGMHGIDAGGGLVVAPWAGGSAEIREETELRCDCCGAPLLLSRHRIGGTFECTQCDQSHSFTEYGHTSKILACLYPEKMAPAMEIKFVEYQRKQFIFATEALLLVDLITQEERDERLANCETDVSARLAELQLLSSPLRHLEWWPRLTRWLGGQ